MSVSWNGAPAARVDVTAAAIVALVAVAVASFVAGLTVAALWLVALDGPGALVHGLAATAERIVSVLP